MTSLRLARESERPPVPLLVPEVEFSDIAFRVVAGDSDVRRRLELPRREMRDGSRRDVLDWTEEEGPRAPVG